VLETLAVVLQQQQQVETALQAVTATEKPPLEPSPQSDSVSGTGASFFVAKASGSAVEDAKRIRLELRTWLRGYPTILEQLNGLIVTLKRRWVSVVLPPPCPFRKFCDCTGFLR
jgi:hypothetical protein